MKRAAAGAALVSGLCLTPMCLTAQGERGDLLSDLARQQRAVLAYIAVAPDSALGWRPTPAVRSLAEQFEHVALAAEGVSAEVVGDSPLAHSMSAGSCACLSTKSRLASFVNETFDRVVARVKRLTPEELTSDLTSYGRTQSRGAWMRWVQEHTAWTLGQTVPYLRLHGVTPPAYLPF